MKLKWCTLCCVAVVTSILTGCGNETMTEQTSENSQQAFETEIKTNQPADNISLESTEIESVEIESTESENVDTESGGNKVLIAYFTRLPNTESGDDLDAVVQGGGPYGEIGESFENADMDAISSASITVTDEGVKGNVETIADWIAEYTGGDTFSIETVEKYPLNYDTLIDQGGEEQQNNDRPELLTHIGDMEVYSVIYLGYPNWYHDMPMALYSFLEEYDLAGKTIIPFTTSAGSGLANTVETIAKIQPEATVVENALALRMGEVKDSKEKVIDWVDSLGIEQ